MTDQRRRSARPRYLNGAALRRKRLEAGLGQAELAALCGTGRPAITHYERGDYGCQIGMLHKLAKAVGCDWSELMLPGALDDDGEAGEDEANGAAA